MSWHDLYDAYGPADAVPGLLDRVSDPVAGVRSDAWHELWGRVVHQGSVYPATLAATGRLIELACRFGYPDRHEALWILHAIASSDDPRVWSYGPEGAIEHDESAGPALQRELRAAVAAAADRLLLSHPDDECVRRAQLLLLSTFPSLLKRHEALVLTTLPDRFTSLWDRLATSGLEGLDEEGMDELSELEEWVSRPCSDQTARGRVPGLPDQGDRDLRPSLLA